MAKGTECEYCGERTFMPYRCRYCNGIFCSDHRLPENHDCVGLRRIRNQPQWEDYAKQVKRRSSVSSGPNLGERWDREEGGLFGKVFGGRLSSSRDVNRMKKALVAVLALSLIFALMIRFVL